MLLKESGNSRRWLLLLVVLLLAGCYKKQNTTEETEPANTPTQAQRSTEAGSKVTGTRASANNQKADVHVYLEISNGMKGFMPPAAADKQPTAFQSRMNRLISEVQDGIYVDSKSYYLAKEDNRSKPVLDSVSYNTLKSTIVNGIKADVRGTPLPAMLQAALQNSVERGAVSIIVSDFIHGPDPSNQGQFFSLDSDIRSSLKLAEHNGLAIAVLADASPFYGTYHPAVKKPEIRRTLNGEEIPYYIWVIGKQDEVQVVINKVLRDLPAQQAYFGFEYDDIPYSAILKSREFKPTGVVYCTTRNAEACTSVNLEPEKDAPVEFVVGLDLSELPASMQEVSYLKRNLKIESNGCKATISAIESADEGVKAIPDLAKYTHFVRLKVTQLTAGSGSMTIQLPQVNPSWIETWSTDNDNNPAAAPQKTYQLSKIIDGVHALYRDRSKYVFNVKMNFNRAN